MKQFPCVIGSTFQSPWPGLNHHLSCVCVGQEPSHCSETRKPLLTYIFVTHAVFGVPKSLKLVETPVPLSPRMRYGRGRPGVVLFVIVTSCGVCVASHGYPKGAMTWKPGEYHVPEASRSMKKYSSADCPFGIQ
jgi:hypothetical protein